MTLRAPDTFDGSNPSTPCPCRLKQIPSGAPKALAVHLAQCVRTFLDDKQGATVIEYGLLAALISAIAVVALTGIGLNVNQLYALVCSAVITPISNAACT